MLNFKIGKGVYIWRPEVIEGGDPQKILARLQMAGVQTVAIQICNGVNPYEGLDHLFKVLRDNGIHVGAWGYSYLIHVPRQEAQGAVNACKRYNPEFYLIDVEKEVEGNDNGAKMFMDVLRPALPDLPLGLNTFWSVSAHPTFPWKAFLAGVDFVCPQVYWRGVDPVGKLKQSQQGYASLTNGKQPVPMPIVAGDMYLSRGVKSTPDQLIQFMDAVNADPSLGGVLMWSADDTQTTPDLWRAFSAYKWKDGGLPIPPQPLGWAKVKALRGLYIRTGPTGSKLGALVKGQLAPIWAVSDAEWAAITPDKSQWIYVGNHDYVEIDLDPPDPAPLPAGIYRARVVPARGLNVRNAIGGTVLRVLPYGTLVNVYEERDGWDRIHPTQSEWVSAMYLSKPI